MKKSDFKKFYNDVIKKLAEDFAERYTEFVFRDDPSAVYEEYLNQKTILRVLFEKKEGTEKSLLDRHKVCACMTVAIIKVRLLSGNIEEKDDCFELSNASRINEQLAFMSSWELFLGFVRLKYENDNNNYVLPDTYHNQSFLDTFTRSLFMANQINALSTPLIANIFFLLEKYCELVDKNTK